MKFFHSKTIIIVGLIVAFIPFIILFALGIPLESMSKCQVNDIGEKFNCLILYKNVDKILLGLYKLPFLGFFSFPVGGIIVLIGILKKVFE